MPLLAMSLVALVRERWVPALAWALPLVFVKEDMGLTVVVIGALVGAGVPEEHAHVYAEGVRRGQPGVFVTLEEPADDLRAKLRALVAEEAETVAIAGDEDEEIADRLRELGYL